MARKALCILTVVFATAFPSLEVRAGGAKANEQQPTTAPAPENKQAAPATPVGHVPKVVEVSPEPGSLNVNPDTEIRVRFDRPMDPSAVALEWKEGFYTPRGQWTYDSERYEFVFPVTMKPYEPQSIELNPPASPGGVPGFRASGGLTAEPYEWSFMTRRDFDNEEAPVPQTVSIEPASGAEVGRITEVRIAFDQPMDPHHLHGIGRMTATGEYEGYPYFYVQYDKEESTFVIPLALPAGWTGELVFEGFRSVEHRHAEPIHITYTVGDEIFSEQHSLRLKAGGANPLLTRLLDQVSAARAGIKTLWETVRASRHAMSERGIYTSFASAGLHFRIDGASRFRGDISGVLGRPFVIAGNEQSCWHISGGPEGTRLTVVPQEEVVEKNILVADPFHSTRSIPTDFAIERMRLEYLGREEYSGRNCYVVQGWSAELRNDELHAYITRWWIDGQLLLPLRVVRDWPAATRVDQQFTYRQVNQPMPESVFQLPADANIPRVPAKPLTPRFNKRFLDMVDPSIGQVLVRWGAKGPGGERYEGVP